MLEVEVALYAKLPEPGEPPLPVNGPSELLVRSGPGTAWSDRPRVKLSVSATDLVQSTLNLAWAEFGFEAYYSEFPDSSWPMGFYRNGAPEIQYLNAIILPDGPATWVFDAHSVTWKDVYAVRDSGMLDADPARIYLQPELRQYGGNGFHFWMEFSRTLPQFLIYVGALYGGARAFIDTGWAGYKVVNKLQRRFHQRHVGVPEISQVVCRPRTSSEIARLLGSSEAEAEALMQLMGLKLKADQTWQSTDDPDSQIVQKIMELATFTAENYIDPSMIDRATAEVAGIPAERQLLELQSILERELEELRAEPEPMIDIRLVDDGDRWEVSRDGDVIGYAYEGRGFLLDTEDGGIQRDDGGKPRFWRALDELEQYLVQGGDPPLENPPLDALGA